MPRWRRRIGQGRYCPYRAVFSGESDLVIDALFGAGLDRPLAGEALDTVAAIASRGLDSLAVDMPSGLAGDSGEVLGLAAPAKAHGDILPGQARPLSCCRGVLIAAS